MLTSCEEGMRDIGSLLGEVEVFLKRHSLVNKDDMLVLNRLKFPVYRFTRSVHFLLCFSFIGYVC